ncbi:MAG: hydroxyacid dehydrogenase [Thiomonas sp.]
MRIVVSEFMDQQAVAKLRTRFGVAYAPQLVDDRAALLSQLHSADALIVRNRTRVDAELLAAAPQLRVVGRLGVGLDNIDLTACAARDIQVIPASGANAQAVAEYVIATAMLLLRGAYLSSAEVAAGAWPRAHLSEGREIAGKTLGLVGFGDIGRCTARLAVALGMRVLAHDPMVELHSPMWAQTGAARRELDALLAESDVVSLHVPLTPQTHNLIDAGKLALMRSGAVLVNTARGGVIDEQALAAALRSGQLGGAALDVFEHEPLAAGSPLAGLRNLILTPHVAGVTRESNARVSTMIAEKVGDFLQALAT